VISHPQELVLAATIHRVKMCEDKLREFEQMVSTLTSTMAQNRAELASKGLERFVIGVTTPLDIPKELVPTYGKAGARRNREYSTVKKRWTLWKHQLDSGMSMSELARAWGVHRTTIMFAKSRNFIVRKAKGGSR
jgi:hypothetical protein